MSDNDTTDNATDNAAAGEATEQQFQIQRVYLKDLSFEAPLGAEAFTNNYQPNISQELLTEIRPLDDNHHEVVLRLTISAKADDKSVFLVEIQQAGVFYLAGIEADALPRVLNTVCPQILFPYARETIDNVLNKGTFPALMLAPVNFDALYLQAMEEQQSQQKH